MANNKGGKGGGMSFEDELRLDEEENLREVEFIRSWIIITLVAFWRAMTKKSISTWRLLLSMSARKQ